MFPFHWISIIFGLEAFSFVIVFVLIFSKWKIIYCSKIRHDVKCEWLLVNQQEAFLCQFGMHDSVLKQRKILPGSLPKYKTVFINYFPVSSMMWYIFHFDAIIQTLLLPFIFRVLWNHFMLNFSRHGTSLYCLLLKCLTFLH